MATAAMATGDTVAITVRLVILAAAAAMVAVLPLHPATGDVLRATVVTVAVRMAVAGIPRVAAVDTLLADIRLAAVAGILLAAVAATPLAAATLVEAIAEH